jgi:hypothetical protein
MIAFRPFLCRLLVLWSTAALLCTAAAESTSDRLRAAQDPALQAAVERDEVALFPAARRVLGA